MKNSMKKELGIVTIRYNEKGEIIETYFKPRLEIKTDGIELQQLKSDLGITTQDELKRSTDLIMATWFMTVNKIELMDHNECQLVSEIKSCTKYRNTDKLKTAKVVFYIQSLPSKVDSSVN